MQSCTAAYRLGMHWMPPTDDLNAHLDHDCDKDYYAVFSLTSLSLLCL